MRNLLLFMFVALVFYNCGKEEEVIVGKSDSFSLQLPSTKVENGILYFQSKEDVKKAYSIIEKALSENEDPDFLKNVESMLGHQSLLFSSGGPITSRTDDNEYTQAEIMAMMEEDFISDDVRKVLLNSHYEIGIANDVQVFFAKDMVFNIINGDQRSISNFRNEPKGGDDFPISIVDPNVELIPGLIMMNATQVEDPSSNGGGDNTGVPVNIPPPGLVADNVFSFTVYANNVDCSIYGKTVGGKLEQRFTDDNNTPNDNSDDFKVWEEWPGDFTLDFGDGNDLTILNEVEFYGNYYYTNLGAFDITYRVDFYDNFGVPLFVEIEEGVVVEFACTNQEAIKSEWQDDGAKALASKIWFKYDVFGSHAGAFSHGYWWKANNAKWKRDYDTSLDVTINATFRDNNCTSTSVKNESDDCNSCAKKQAQVTDLFVKRDVSNGDIYSTHSSICNNGSNFTNSLVLNPCD